MWVCTFKFAFKIEQLGEALGAPRVQVVTELLDQPRRWQRGRSAQDVAATSDSS